MNISFEYYRIFYVVAKYGNITKAADELMISQPAISKCIKLLEDQLGGQLFIRTKRGVVLTEEGKEFYKYIKHAIEYINNAENKFTEMIQKLKSHDLILFANEKNTARNYEEFKTCNNIAVIIGSEGGFSDNEIKLIQDASALNFGLGERILRAETAAIAVSAILGYIVGV